MHSSFFRIFLKLSQTEFDSRVLNAQRSQFIALLKEFEDVNVYFKNPLTGTVKIEYNELYYYENSERWILGEGLESDTMR